MTTLVVGATGATGKWLVQHLLDRGQDVRVIVRSKDGLPEEVRNHPKLTVTEAALLDLSDTQMATQVNGCTAVASCLGHNLTLKGMYGKPRDLCTAATRRLTQAIESNEPKEKVKFILMNSAGVCNQGLDEPKRIGWAQWTVTGIIRGLVPPHGDNEAAAEYLRSKVGGKSAYVDWSVVRPDSLIDATTITGYTPHVSPLSDPIFNPGKVTRINVAAFMADLITDKDGVFGKWKYQMPVLYNDDAHPKV